MGRRLPHLDLAPLERAPHLIPATEGGAALERLPQFTVFTLRKERRDHRFNRNPLNDRDRHPFLPHLAIVIPSRFDLYSILIHTYATLGQKRRRHAKPAYLLVYLYKTNLS